MAEPRPRTLLLSALTACAVAAWLPGCRDSAPEPNAKPSFLILSLDTTRADRLGIYGYARPTSPNLDRLAHEGAWYEHAYTTATWTLPAHASLFTGKFPTSHGARYDPDGPLVLDEEITGPAAYKLIRARGLGAGESTLAERLRDAGWRTGGIVAGPWLKQVFGLSRGFDDWDDRDITSVNGRPGRAVTDAAIAWLDADPQRPFLLFLNYFDAHSPYYPPARFLNEVAPPEERPNGEAKTITEISALYDAEIRAMDFQIGRLLEHLRETGRYDSTWIVAVADHGELLGEQNATGHGTSLFEPELRIPLLVKPPPGQSLRGARSEPIQISDVFPMLLEAAGLPVPASAQSTFPPPADRPVFAEVNPLPKFGRRGAWRGVVHGNWKYLESAKGDRLLFDLASDPGETTNVAPENPAVAERLRTTLEAWKASLPPPALSAAPSAEVDAATREALESLGYLDGDAPAAAPSPPP